jgi:NAD(P)-dependent dehydrogenase (short-subunit alcohol dehydrogenase family)
MAKTVLVTGTSSGVGYETALALARAGFTVIATMRNLDKAARLREQAQKEGLAIELAQLDVEDAESIERAIQETIAKHGRLDALVNNAGAGHVASLEQTTVDDLQRTLNVNFFGVWKVTQAVLPHMRRARSGHIVTVTSVGGLLGQPFNDAYCAAKFAIEGFMESLAPVVKRLGVNVSLVEPGAINTEFAASADASIKRIRQTAGEDYLPIFESYLRATEEAYARIGQSGADVARVIVDALSAAKPHFRYVTSDLVRGLVARKYVDPTGDSVLALVGARLPAIPDAS